ncbi:hypothetical protein [Streptomyces sp. NPDC090994]|uniref:hypothetical protein n=1 Tax=Streptomyces sp. NPDC090994 TaxID=3365969 RepID=UPI003822A645
MSHRSGRSGWPAAGRLVKATAPKNNAFRRTFEDCLSASRALAARPDGGQTWAR